jgi:hypothetical protein
MCTQLLLSKSIWPRCAQPSPSSNKNLLKMSIICERYWLQKLSPTFGQHMEPPPKTSNANLTKNPTCLEYKGFVSYFPVHMVVGTTLH